MNAAPDAGGSEAIEALPRPPDAPPFVRPTPLQLALRPWRRRLREYLLLTRMHRPIGTLLLLWPVLWAVWIASAGAPDFGVLAVFVLGTFLTRSAGCVINDFADRDFDPHVRRTRERPLAARRVSPYEAIGLFVVLMLLAFLLVLQLDALTIRMSLVGAVLAATYPFFKRFFPAPQLYLGIAFGWGVPMAFAAQLGEVPRVGWLVFLVTVTWAGVYDTLYAMVDRDDDRLIGIRSTALLFGDMDRVAIGAMQVIMLWGLVLVGQGMGFGRPYWAGLAVAALLFAWQQWLARGRERDACFEAFLNNNYVGFVVFVGIAADYALRR
ncbi:MAG: 4-hydroxybenzoate octaprenyltransferase [Steroidobacteraceae bacterium]|jgi:4-hydroxybenzoate polyprenyltransferase|nr:4-hydroxybenzoate octaprenyltransferase [Steroidobacteraceae bacterium]